MEENFACSDQLRDTIYDLLEQAKRSDPSYSQFGAHSHKYCLNPPLPPEAMRAIEREYGFTFPEDYFWFMTCVGNGGAGPDYGIDRIYLDSTGSYPFSDDDEYRHAKHDHMNLFCDAEEWKAIVNNWHDDTDEEMLYHGMVVIGQRGCTLVTMLVVTGEHRGCVVYSDEDYGFAHHLSPHGKKSFLDWYMSWLHETILGCNGYGYAALGTPDEIMSQYDNANEDVKMGLLYSLYKAKHGRYISNTSRNLMITEYVERKLYAIFEADSFLECRQMALTLMEEFRIEGWVDLVKRCMMQEDWVDTCSSISWHASSRNHHDASWHDSLLAALPVAERAVKNRRARYSSLVTLLRVLLDTYSYSIDTALPLLSEKYTITVYEWFLRGRGVVFPENHWKTFFLSVHPIVSSFLADPTDDVYSEMLRDGISTVFGVVKEYPETRYMAKNILLPLLENLHIEFMRNETYHSTPRYHVKMILNILYENDAS